MKIHQELGQLPVIPMPCCPAFSSWTPRSRTATVLGNGPTSSGHQLREIYGIDAVEVCKNAYKLASSKFTYIDPGSGWKAKPLNMGYFQGQQVNLPEANHSI
jgi:hypothetical protein